MLTWLTVVFWRLTFRNSFPVMNSTIFSSVRSTLFLLFLLLHSIRQSSAYRTYLCPLRSSSLSSSFSMIFPHNGLNGPPCGTPSIVAWNPLSSITPTFRYLCIRDITLPSLTAPLSACCVCTSFHVRFPFGTGTSYCSVLPSAFATVQLL